MAYIFASLRARNTSDHKTSKKRAFIYMEARFGFVAAAQFNLFKKNNLLNL